MDNISQVDATVLQICSIKKVFFFFSVSCLHIKFLSFLPLCSDKRLTKSRPMHAVRQCTLGMGIQWHLLPLDRPLHYSDVTIVFCLQFIVEKLDQSSKWGLFLPPCESLTNSMNSSNCEGHKYNQVYLFLLGSWHKILRLIWSQKRVIFRMFTSFSIFLSTCYIVKLPPKNRMFYAAGELT